MSSIESGSKILVGVATVGALGYTGYILWKCYKKRGSISPGSLTTCLVEGVGSVGWDVTKDLGKEIWKDTKPLLKSINKSVLKPTGKWVEKAGKTAFVDTPKMLANETYDHALKPTGKWIGGAGKTVFVKTPKRIAKGLKKAVSKKSIKKAFKSLFH